MESYPSPEPFLHNFWVPSKGAPPPPSRFCSQSSHRGRCSVSRALLRLFLFPVNGSPPPHASQRGPYGERCPPPKPSTLYDPGRLALCHAPQRRDIPVP
jgi:hypothetical protein